ncbi:MAG: hypothetical protein ACTSP4_09695 [Candidatus Hodarchaeales archaeon]
MERDETTGSQLQKRSKRKALVKFVRTNKTFVLLTGKKQLKLSLGQKKDIAELSATMPLDERIDFYMANFESIFVNLFPDDIGYFSLVPDNDKDFAKVERDFQKISGI